MPVIDLEKAKDQISKQKRNDQSFDNLFLTKHAHQD